MCRSRCTDIPRTHAPHCRMRGTASRRVLGSWTWKSTRSEGVEGRAQRVAGCWHAARSGSERAARATSNRLLVSASEQGGTAETARSALADRALSLRSRFVALQPVLLDLLDERRARNAKLARGPSPIGVMRSQRPIDMNALHLGKR